MRFLHSRIANPAIVQVQKISHLVPKAETGRTCQAERNRRWAKEMAVLDLDHGSVKSPASQGGKSLLRSIANYFERRAVYNETLRELSMKTDRELGDLGIRRLDMERIAREAAAIGR